MRFLYESCQILNPGNSGGFLRTLHNHPEVASYVREILVGGSCDGRSASENDLSMSKAEMTAHIRTLSLPYEDTFVEAIALHPEEVELALLVWDARTSLQVLSRLHHRYSSHAYCSTTPLWNLRRHGFHSTPEDNAHTPHRAFWITPLLHAAQQYVSAPADASIGFAKLCFLSLDMTGIPMAKIAPVLHLPSLKTLELHDISYGVPSLGIDHGSWDIRPRSSQIQNISIIWPSEPPLSHITQLLQSCATVSSFRCDQPDKPDDNIVDWHSALLEAARSHSETLKKLEIRIDGNGAFTWTGLWPRNYFLSGMKELEELELDYTAIVGKQRGIHYPELPETPEPARSLRDLLPPNLVELRLDYQRSAMNANVDYTSELRGLVQDNPNCPRKIKKLRIYYVHDIVHAAYPFSLHGLQEYFKAHGLEFHYTVKYKIDNECKCFMYP